MSIPKHKTVVRHRIIWRLVCILFIFILSLAAVFSQQNQMQDTVYLFSYFKANGDDGLHLAFSFDGLRWTALKQDTSFLRPLIGSKLMRDPSICRGPDGMFHMVWTTGWWDNGIGIAHSKDLINWSEQTFLAVMAHEPEAKNCWAPEIFYDEQSKQYLIFWATTIPGRFPQTKASGDNNHRIYFVTTSDFRQYSETRLFYDPGFNIIDSFIARDGKRFVMFCKDETKLPVVQKNIRVAFSDRAQGPYGAASEPITGNYWAEGPAAIKVKDRWIVYFDKYRLHKYGAVMSRDLKSWQDISDRVEFPDGARHGTVFKVEERIVKNLIENSQTEKNRVIKSEN